MHPFAAAVKGIRGKGLTFLHVFAIIVKHHSYGELAEWSKAHDWKSCVPFKGTQGSNP